MLFKRYGKSKKNIVSVQLTNQKLNKELQVSNTYTHRGLLYRLEFIEKPGEDHAFYLSTAGCLGQYY